MVIPKKYKGDPLGRPGVESLWGRPPPTKSAVVSNIMLKQKLELQTLKLTSNKKIFFSYYTNLNGIDSRRTAPNESLLVNN